MSTTCNTHRTINHLTTVAAACGVSLAAALAVGPGGPVTAAPTTALFVGGGGIAVHDGNGAIAVEGPGLVQDKHLRDMLDATIRATMATTEGELPDVGECKPATATLVVDGERDADMTLTGNGTVCRVQNPSFPTYVTIEYDGLHHVVEAKRPRLRGVGGSLSITVTPGGFTSVHADSFVPPPS
jgi:hypothetical protein